MYPFTPYKIDSKFGQKVSYGTHEGIDLNGLGGGNTDCGTVLKSISTGTCVHISGSTKDYGVLVVIETVFNGTTYWIRYCHLQQTELSVGESVEMGQEVGLMGSTGNSTACHLHLDILKKKPATWRFYTQEVFDWFVDPLWFMENYKEEHMYTEEQMTTVRLERDKNWNLYKEAEKKVNSIVEKADEYKEARNELRTQLGLIKQDLGLPQEAKIEDVYSKIKALVSLQNTPPAVPGNTYMGLPVIKGWKLNGMEIKTVVNGLEAVLNYKLNDTMGEL